MTPFHRLRVATLLALCALLGSGCHRASEEAGEPKASKETTVAASPPGPAQVTPPSFAQVAANANPAVVFIETQQAARIGSRRVIGRGLGSGFAFDPSGLILTNYHVVEDATTITVTLPDQEPRRAELVGHDAQTDIAVLRISGDKIPYLSLGDSDKLQVGDWVLAIGNPFGLSHTVSAGIVSAKGRTRSDVKGLDPAGYYDFLQTDASINPGNSGGPLIDLAGQVVGINTAIKADANSIGFAIPMAMIRELLPQLLKQGKVRRSAVGVVVDSVTRDDVSRLGLQSIQGALITRVMAGGPAQRAGAHSDDVIVNFDNKPITGKEMLRWLASIAGVGRSVSMRVIRAQRPVDLRVTLGELPAAEGRSDRGDDSPEQ
ncbi:MAG TPA: trypsin-like peptidase domain-containing protein [Polyangiaceae bacterium]|nr:trypsin-like peptidase domain-containing protein [Polyangiaceae bacterium]